MERAEVANEQLQNGRAMINRGPASPMTFFPPSATNGNGNQNTTAAVATSTGRMQSDNGNGNCDTDNNMAILKNADQEATLIHQHRQVGE